MSVSGVAPATARVASSDRLAPFVLDGRSLREPLTGVGRYTLALVRGLSAVGVPVRVLADARQAVVGVDERMVVRAPRWAAVRVLRPLYERYGLERAVMRAGAVTFHGTGFRFPQRARRLVRVVTVQDLASFCYPTCQSSLGMAYLRMQIRAAVRRAHRIIVPTEAVAEQLVTRFPRCADRVRTTLLGVEPRFFRVAQTARPRPCAAHFLSVATLERRKNLANVLRAMARVVRVEPQARLTLIGWRWNAAAQLEALIGRLGLAGRVELVGYVDDEVVERCYGRATALLYPSLYEGFGLPILEAMAAGCPVITSDRGAMREVAGDAALLVDPTDVEAIADAMLAVTRAEVRERLRRAGRQRARRFRWEDTVAQTIEVYREACAAARRSRGRA